MDEVALESAAEHERKCAELAAQGSCLATTLRLVFEAYANRPCLGLVLGEWVSYQQVFSRALHFAACLVQALPRGSHVAILGRNSIDFIAADLGVLISGNVSVIMQETSDTSWIEEQLEMCHAVFADVKYSSVCGPKLLMPLCEAWTGPGSGVCSADLIYETCNPNERRTIVLTSGTNGRSKGLVLHDEWFNNFIKNPWPYSPLVNILGFMPFSHQTGRMMAFTMFFNGGCGFIHKSGGTLEQLFEELQVVQPTMMVSAPRLYDFLVSEHTRERQIIGDQAANEKYRRVFGERMQCICTGGAQTSEATLEWLRRYFVSLVCVCWLFLLISCYLICRCQNVSLGSRCRRLRGVRVRSDCNQLCACVQRAQTGAGGGIQSGGGLWRAPGQDPDHGGWIRGRREGFTL